MKEIMADPKIHPKGGGPTRNTSLPTDAAGRKQYPIATGFLDYFPDAVAAVAHLSWKGNQQHNPGEETYWNRAKSGDEPDTMLRHFLQRGTLDGDGIRHSAKLAWRALAILQKEIEAEQAADRPEPAPQIVPVDERCATVRVMRAKGLCPTACHGDFRPDLDMCSKHAGIFYGDLTMKGF